MHVVVSISFATVAIRPVAPAGLPGVAEIALRRLPIIKMTGNVATKRHKRHRDVPLEPSVLFCGYILFSYLIEINQEPLVLWSPGIWIQHTWAQVVYKRPGDSPDEAPMNGQSDLINSFPAHLKPAHALGHHGSSFDGTAGGTNTNHL